MRKSTPSTTIEIKLAVNGYPLAAIVERSQF
jgi:hypothetical protein